MNEGQGVQAPEDARVRRAAPVGIETRAAPGLAVDGADVLLEPRGVVAQHDRVVGAEVVVVPAGLALGNGHRRGEPRIGRAFLLLVRLSRPRQALDPAADGIDLPRRQVQDGGGGRRDGKGEEPKGWAQSGRHAGDLLVLEWRHRSAVGPGARDGGAPRWLHFRNCAITLKSLSCDYIIVVRRRVLDLNLQ